MIHEIATCCSYINNDYLPTGFYATLNNEYEKVMTKNI